MLRFLFHPQKLRRFIAFLHNSVLPPLLSEKQEREALERMAAGSEEARNQLIEGNLRLVAHICKKFESTGVDREDLISIGTIGLIKGISTFSADKGTRLATYSARCIENEILMHLRSIKNQRTEVSLYDPVGTDKEGNEVSLIDILGSQLPSAQEKVEADEERSLIREKIAVLTDQERFVVESRYGLCGGERLTQKEIAAKLGISRSYISRIEKKAVGKLKHAIHAEC